MTRNLRVLTVAACMTVFPGAAAVAQQGAYGQGGVNTHNPGGQTIINNYYGSGSPQGGRARRGSLRWSSNQWVEGDGDLNVFAASKPQCSQACLEEDACVFVEYHRPTGTCNLFSYVPPTKSGNEADVAYK